MEEFPSNSINKPKAKAKAEKKIEPVVSGPVVRRKMPVGRRFKEYFFGGQDARGVWQYVFHDVMVPAAKDLIVDAGQTALERTFYPDSRGPSRRSGGGMPQNSPFGKVNYQSVSKAVTKANSAASSRPISDHARANFKFDEIVLPTRADADAVLAGMFELLSAYDVVSVSDFYQLTNVDTLFTDEKYGWTNLGGARVQRDRGQYILNLPRPELID